MKRKFMISIGMSRSLIASLFGGGDIALETLTLFMAIDWFTGGILRPSVFRKSPKSKNGALESRAGFKGLCRKTMILFAIACRKSASGTFFCCMF